LTRILRVSAFDLRSSGLVLQSPASEVTTVWRYRNSIIIIIIKE